MNAIIWYLLYAAMTALTGYTVLCLTSKKRNVTLPLVMALSCALGTGIVSFFLFYLSLVGFSPNRYIIGLISIGSVVLLGGIIYKKKWIYPSLPSLKNISGLDWLFLSLLIVLLSVVIIETVGTPVHNIDAIAIWELKAKVLSQESVKQTDYFTDLTKSYSHLDYPLLLPLYVAGFYSLSGVMESRSAQFAHVFFYLTFLCLLYSALRHYLSRTPVLILLTVYFSAPLLMSQSAAGLADLPLMIFYLGAVMSVGFWRKSHSSKDLLMAALMLAFLCFTKNEGYALAIIICAVLIGQMLLRKEFPYLKKAGLLFLIAAAITLPWFIFLQSIPKTHENYAARLALSGIFSQLNRIPTILHSFFTAVLSLNQWGAFWVVFIAFSIAGARSFKRGAVLFLLSVLCFHGLLYLLVFIITPWDLPVLLGIKTQPLLLLISPIALLIIAAIWKELEPAASVLHNGITHEK